MHDLKHRFNMFFVRYGRRIRRSQGRVLKASMGIDSFHLSIFLY